jgi:hypothetical protein
LLEPLEGRQLLSGGTWTQLANLDPAGTGTMLLLPNGSVMIQGNDNGGVSNRWDELVPNSGNYVAGTFASLASMHVQRLYYTTDVLPNNNIFLIGGEYTGAQQQRTLTNTAEMYNPITNKWITLPSLNDASKQVGDSPSEVLQNGDILIGPKEESTAYLYNPKTKTYTQTGSKLRSDINDEETWIKLLDGSILTYDIWASIANGVGSAERYVPSQGAWVDAGQVPVLLSTPANGYEMGPGLLLADGRVFQVGANGNTALYAPSTNTWAAGPVIPGGYVADDAPGAILPNGNVIFAADQPVYNPPTALFDFDPVANTITQLSLPQNLANELAGSSAYPLRMLMLPTGQLLLNTGGSDLWALTPDTGANAAWQPVIQGITANTNGSYTLKGTQLNGISEGASYGDDAGMAENYPIVALQNAQMQVYYARTYDWTSVGVQTGKAVIKTHFQLPSGIPAGSYSLTVIADGIASNPVSFTVGASPAAALSLLPGQLALQPEKVGSTEFTTKNIARRDESTALSLLTLDNTPLADAASLQLQGAINGLPAVATSGSYLLLDQDALERFFLAEVVDGPA